MERYLGLRKFSEISGISEKLENRQKLRKFQEIANFRNLVDRSELVWE